ncbi:hypothetical protein [Chitinibacter tainanensis]|uniref:hypothetical protein n=1 Tax=Chitinibacter tainanensis TaxID=230667 RepID=UPI0023542F10|nr:hypothetical protein [Chitinibacter tainanensis]
MTARLPKNALSQLGQLQLYNELAVKKQSFQPGAICFSPPRPGNARWQTALSVLADSFECGNLISREAFDCAVGCSNGPDLMANLRKKCGIVWLCRRIPVIDRHDEVCQAGFYAISPASYRAIRAWLKSLEPAK